MRPLGSILFAALIVAAYSATDTAGPASPEVVGLTAAGAPSDIPPPVYLLTDFNSSTLVLSATDGFGDSIAVPFSNTIFRETRIAPSDPYTPTCRALVESYNTTDPFGDTLALYAVIGSMADAGCHARIWVDHRTNTVRMFAPSDPYFPNDPI